MLPPLVISYLPTFICHHLLKPLISIHPIFMRVIIQHIVYSSILILCLNPFWILIYPSRIGNGWFPIFQLCRKLRTAILKKLHPPISWQLLKHIVQPSTTIKPIKTLNSFINAIAPKLAMKLTLLQSKFIMKTYRGGMLFQPRLMHLRINKVVWHNLRWI